jgi:hypothetical protein
MAESVDEKLARAQRRLQGVMGEETPVNPGERKTFTKEQDRAVSRALVYAWLAGFLAGLMLCMFLAYVVGLHG